MGAWVRIGTVLSVGIAVAFVLRAVLPNDPGLFLQYGNVARGIPLYRVAFWVCLAVTLIVAIVVARMTKPT